MFRKPFTVFIILLSVMLALSACSKKEEAVEGKKLVPKWLCRP